MSYEPKFKLNQKDDARWHMLLTRHCLDCPAKPGKKRKFSREYPPLSPAEDVEFEALCAKRNRKIESNPKVRASIEASKKHSRKVQRLLRKLDKVLKRIRYARQWRVFSLRRYALRG